MAQVKYSVEFVYTPINHTTLPNDIISKKICEGEGEFENVVLYELEHICGGKLVLVNTEKRRKYIHKYYIRNLGEHTFPSLRVTITTEK